MIKIEVGKSIEQALKKYKEKYAKVKISRELNERKQYKKPSIERRKVKGKAIYNNRKIKED
jgi:small subunit ribosomal protein S21